MFWGVRGGRVVITRVSGLPIFETCGMYMTRMSNSVRLHPLLRMVKHQETLNAGRYFYHFGIRVNSHQKLLAGTPHIVHAFKHLPVFKERKQPNVVRALGHRVQVRRGFLRTQIPYFRFI